MKHFLQTLGLQDDASWNQIKEAYRDQIRVWHPDRFAGDARLHAKAEEMTKEIHYALRRLKELRGDLEKQNNYIDEATPFLKQYYLKTDGGRGDHGRVTSEDRSRGYLQESFGKWEAITGVVRQTIRRQTKQVSQQQLRRSRRPTVIIKKKQTSNIPAFLVSAGVLVVVASIGAIRIPELLHPENGPNSRQQSELSPQAERKLLQTLLEEPPPNYQKKLDQRAKLDLIEQRKREQMPLVVTAAMNCDTRQLESLVVDRDGLDATDSSGQTALMWAAKRNCPVAIRMLAKRGANTALRSSNGFTALHWATWYKNDDAAKTLRALGVKE